MFPMQMALVKSTEFLDAQILHPDLAKMPNIKMLVLRWYILENIFALVYLKLDFMLRFLRRENQLIL
jgi:hypothetical protein